jgi:hypothetical protein
LVDTTTLIVLSTLVQTAVITLTLLVFIFQFRSQEKAIKESSYQNVMGRYNDFIMGQASSPQMSGLFVDQVRSLGNLKETTQQEATSIAHLLIAYGIIEEAFGLYKKKWIDEETWEQWAAWLKALCKHPQFYNVHTFTSGMFDKDFQNYVSKALSEINGAPQQKE